MNKLVKTLLLGLIIWAIPFVVSFLVWDMAANAPRVGMDWFNAIMAFFWALGFGIAAYMYFKDIKKNTVKEGWTTGVIWYVELLLLDLLFLVGIFGMAMMEYYPMLLTYLNAVVLSAAIGYMLKK